MEDLEQYLTTACLAPSLATTLPAKATFHHATWMIIPVPLDVLQAEE